jgi:Plasmid pRiA4b ORF-3-like protein
MDHKQKKNEDLFEIVLIKEEATEVFELIDLSKPSIYTKIPVPIDQLKSRELLDINTLKTLEVLHNEKQVLIKSSKFFKSPIVIEIASEPEPSAAAVAHPAQKRKLPWRSSGPSSSYLHPGTYASRKLTPEELLNDKSKQILQNCKKFSRSKIQVLPDHTTTENLIIELKLQIMFIPIKIFRTIQIPFKSTLKVLQKVIQDLYKVSTENCMFIYHDTNKNLVFLNNPSKSDLEKERDKGLIDFMSIMDVLDFEIPEVYFVSDHEDSWYVSIKIRKVLDKSDLDAYPVCVGGRHPPPPQDITPTKFTKVVKVFAEPENPKHYKYSAKYTQWRSQKFNKLEVDFPSLNVFYGRIRFNLN